MKRTSNLPIATFVTCLSAVALITNCQFPFSNTGGPESDEIPEALREETGKDAVDDVEIQFKTRLLNDMRRGSTSSFALLVSSPDGKNNPYIESLLTQRHGQGGLEIKSSFFKPAFIEDGHFKDAWNESTSLFQRLELSNRLGGIILGQENLNYAVRPDLNDLITATLDFEVKIIPFRGTVSRKAWKFRTVGPGFTQSDARFAAEERLLKVLENDQTFGSQSSNVEHSQ